MRGPQDQTQCAPLSASRLRNLAPSAAVSAAVLARTRVGTGDSACLAAAFFGLAAAFLGEVFFGEAGLVGEASFFGEGFCASVSGDSEVKIRWSARLSGEWRGGAYGRCGMLVQLERERETHMRAS